MSDCLVGWWMIKHDIRLGIQEKRPSIYCDVFFGLSAGLSAGYFDDRSMACESHIHLSEERCLHEHLNFGWECNQKY